MRTYVLASLLLATLGVGAGAAQAKKPRTLHCKHGYVKKRVTVKKHRHGHVIRVKATRCVKAPAPSSKTISVTSGPVPIAPAPTPVPTPAPKAPALEISVSVWDPINVENPECESPKPGKRFIAVELGVTNTSTSTVSSNANLDTAIIGTDSQTYTAVFDERKGCSNFSYGDFTLTPGAHEVGCVVYELPEGVKAAKVQFGLELGVVEQSFSVEGR
jgi:Domain of unknown function (DUF4352)